MKKAWLIVLSAVLLSSACAAKNKDSAGGQQEDGGTRTTQASGGAAAAVKFGDAASPCGPGNLKVDPAENAGVSDKLLIGVANDRSSTIRPGLNKEIWDASNAFAEWCNSQGGIGGLPIEIVDLDGKLLEVEAAMTKACAGVFMMVGGGYVQDNLEFSGKDGSDFHKCKMADIPAFAVSPEKAESNGQIQPVPNPSSNTPSTWLTDFKALHPKEAESMAEVWGDLPAMKTIKEKTDAVIAAEGVKNAGDPSYPVTGLSDWTPLAKQIIDSGTQSMHFVGEPTNLGSLVKTMREQGWKGYPVLETNHYDQTYVDSAGAANAAGSIIRSTFHPFEEADQWPAVKQYQDLVKKYVPDAKLALLGMQSFSAWLLFATSANACGKSNNDTLTRACVLKAAADIKDWTAGGLHAPTDPGPLGGPSPACGMLLQVKPDGTFARLYPEIKGKGDDSDGFHCPANGSVEVPANKGLGVTSPDQPV